MEILILLALVIIAILGYIVFSQMKSKNVAPIVVAPVVKQMTEEEAIDKASKIATEKIIEAEKKALDIETKAQASLNSVRQHLQQQEKLLNDREKNLIERTTTIESRLNQLDKKEEEILTAKKEVELKKDALLQEIETVSKMSREEAATKLKAEVEIELTDWMAKKIRESELQVSQKADDRAKDLLVEAMSSAATDYVAETTTTTITIDDETLKSKIIGKQGRNIRTFEKLTGVDLIVDETPNQVTISCFDPIRREVAALTLNKLLSDGRVHPGSIEETVDKVKKDLLKVIKKTGEDMAYETGFNDLPNEIIMLLGRFKYRFSYGQNLVKHTLEMVKIAEVLAKEIKADVRTAKLACLLHDIGKVAPEEGKQHHHISAEIARKYFKNDNLINAIEAHHYDIDSKCKEAEIVRIADAISGARPGARVENYEDYVKRIRALEDIAHKQKGVKECFAIYAGREIRVIVNPTEASDEDAKVMAYNIAKEIEATQNYPGVIKVTVIRETRETVEAK